jgi:DNA-binding NtrC family response regulator
MRQMPVSAHINRSAVRGHAITRENKKGLLVLLEPDPSVRDALTVLLAGEGWQVEYADDCETLSALVEQGGVAAVLSESNLTDCSPQEILEESMNLGVPVVFMGHDLPLQGAVDLIRQGAVDFLDKPFPQSRLLDLLERLDSGHNE